MVYCLVITKSAIDGNNKSFLNIERTINIQLYFHLDSMQ